MGLNLHAIILIFFSSSTTEKSVELIFTLIKSILSISYNTVRVLWLIYMYNAQGRTAPESEYIYIRQSTSACVITNISIPMRGQIKGFDRSLNQL